MTEPTDPALLRAADENSSGMDSEVRVTWAELFFDLVFVFAVTEVSALLRGDPTWLGVAHAAVVFVPIYWVWVGTCVYANTHGVTGAAERLGVFAVGLCGLFMALATPGAFGERGVLFGAAYFTARLVLVALVWRGGRTALAVNGVAATVSGPLLVVGGFLPPPARLAVWALAAVVDLSTPAVKRRWLMSVRFAPAHLAERFGGFLIIALGESIVATGVPAAAAGRLPAGTAGAVAAAFVLACGLWWVYYVYAASAVRHALETAEVTTDIVRRVLSYGHLAFVGAVIAVAAGMAAAIEAPGEPLAAGPANLLYGGCALYLATFGYTRWRMFRSWSVTRLSAAGVVLALAPAAPHVPALVALCSLGVVLVILNVAEPLILARRARSGQPA